MNLHTEHSSFREKLIEHLFVGELLKYSWRNGDCGLEIAKPEVDNSGYDIIAENFSVIRHIQLKATYIGGATTHQKIHTKLSEKPSGCVVWIYFDAETMDLGAFYFFGGQAGEPLPDIQNQKVAKHTRGNKDGQKAVRPNVRDLNRGSFEKLNTIEEVYKKLFEK